MIKAIETVYNGYRFRSRLEARWAVFFDCVGVKYQYEPEGFDLDGVWYLPDFYLPQLEMWAEVKAEQFSMNELEKAISLAINSKKPAIMLVGSPELKEYMLFRADEESGKAFSSTIRINGTEKAVIAAKQARFEHGEKLEIVSTYQKTEELLKIDIETYKDDGTTYCESIEFIEKPNIEPNFAIIGHRAMVQDLIDEAKEKREFYLTQTLGENNKIARKGYTKIANLLWEVEKVLYRIYEGGYT
jgi:hypothetical protein